MKEQVVVLFLYFLTIYIIGILATRITQSNSDYILGGRRFGPIITAMGVGASDMGSWMMMGLPGAVYIYGVSGIWMAIGLSIGQFINWSVIAKRLRIYTEISGSLTIPEFLAARYPDKAQILKTVTAIAIMVFFSVYAASALVSSCKVFNIAFGISYTNSLYISFFMVFVYTLIGGFIAVNWIDLFQGILMFLALIILPIACIHSFGSWENIINTCINNNINFNQPTYGLSNLAIISALGWGLGYFGQPHIIVRFMATEDAKNIKISRVICMVWMIVALIGAILVGLLGSALSSDSPLSDPETVLMHLSSQLFNPYIDGLMLAAVLSAIMSTISCQLLTSASALGEDLFIQYTKYNYTSKNKLLINRIAVLIVSGIAFMLAYNPKSSILSLVEFAWSGLGSAFGPKIKNPIKNI